MNSFYSQLALSSAVLALAVILGGMLPLAFKWFRKHLPVLLSGSAGVMLGATLLHLLPEAIKLVGAQASYWVLGGFLLLYVFERFVTVHICEALECEFHSLGVAAVVGISTHALTDGVALGSGLLVSGLGLVILLSIFFHKLPEAFALTSILLHEGKSRTRIIFFNLFLILMIPLGGCLLYWFVGETNTEWTGYALAFSAGTFLHIAISDLLPEVHKFSERRYTLFISFFVGLILMYFIGELTHPLGH